MSGLARNCVFGREETNERGRGGGLIRSSQQCRQLRLFGPGRATSLDGTREWQAGDFDRPDRRPGRARSSRSRRRKHPRSPRQNTGCVRRCERCGVRARDVHRRDPGGEAHLRGPCDLPRLQSSGSADFLPGAHQRRANAERLRRRACRPSSTSSMPGRG